ncbi:hypothetical protein FC26_GL000466 [Paucilactobacillus vaccinostercus DSM 20634]|uniref:Uncharacterized protein n=1 Tax=Paucilactobacillus vaccinostercus DSM 20634 TaxID=1423813 RepID=A0A0R2A080_9LACO|nr:hypothetical protein [Paucilactobacillus vaccinostercus]KRM60381.1 hypothetical protein FC26_GL000466 [Paucilactobacillus vaccinostercus DSM 20634]
MNSQPTPDQRLTNAEMTDKVTRLKTVSTPVDVTQLQEAKLHFKDQADILIPSRCVQELEIKADPESENRLKGLILSINLEDCNDEIVTILTKQLQTKADIDELSLKFMDHTEQYEVVWSPLSTDEANYSQKYAITQETVTIIAEIPKRYDWHDLLKVAEYPEFLNKMATTVSDLYNDWSYEKAIEMFYAQIHEMSRLLPDAEIQDDRKYLWARYRKEVDDDGWDDHWDPVIYDPFQENEYSDDSVFAVDFVPYSEILGMQVQVDSDGDFWDGIAWLLWEISYDGVSDEDRNAAAQSLKVTIDDGLRESKTMDEVAHRIDYYVTTHITDPTLPDFVDRYWPLVTGPNETDPMFLDMGVTHVAELDETLYHEFIEKFGALTDSAIE